MLDVWYTVYVRYIFRLFILVCVSLLVCFFFSKDQQNQLRSLTFKQLVTSGKDVSILNTVSMFWVSVASNLDNVSGCGVFQYLGSSLPWAWTFSFFSFLEFHIPKWISAWLWPGCFCNLHAFLLRIFLHYNRTLISVTVLIKPLKQIIIIIIIIYSDDEVLFDCWQAFNDYLCFTPSIANKDFEWFMKYGGTFKVHL